MALRGDMIGCELVYGERYYRSNTISVHFTLNGKFIGDASLTTEDDRYPYFYPYVGIGFEGITLQMKVSDLFYFSI
jgi:hypothetical protein